MQETKTSQDVVSIVVMVFLCDLLNDYYRYLQYNCHIILLDLQIELESIPIHYLTFNNRSGSMFGIKLWVYGLNTGPGPSTSN
jgi:hypothetical protein